MKTENAKKWTAAALATALCCAGAPAPASGQEPEETYEPQLEPGLRVSGPSYGNTALAEAARSRRSIVLGNTEPEEPRRPVSSAYLVREGDTLWDICDTQLGDPYEWPRIWSYNPEITNPHWIYPGDSLSMTPRGHSMTGIEPELAETPLSAPAPAPSSLYSNRQAFVDTETIEKAGVIVGAHVSRMLLAKNDEAYVEFESNDAVRPGAEFAAYEVLHSVEAPDDPDTELGKLVEILGKVRVVSYDPETKIARVTIEESHKEMERSALIGPTQGNFELIPPVRADKDLEGHIIAFLDPVEIAATHQVAFIDKGKTEGVVKGNRFFAVEQVDRWRESRGEEQEKKNYPKEIIGELRVIDVRPHTSTVLITYATTELSVGQIIEMREGD